MKRSILVVVIILLAFNSVTQALTMDWVTVGNAGNANDSTSFGGVSDVYQIGKYEVTAVQYTEFLNAVAATDTYGLYNTVMDSRNYGCQIQRSGSYGSYSYSVASDYADRPVNYVGWYDTLRFSNWLHNGQPTGGQTADTTEDGAYDMSLGTSVVRKADAQVFLPSEDEWYKAAYHKNDGVTGNYFDYPTSNDSAPSNILDGGNNNATFSITGNFTIGSPYWRTEVGAHENSYSPYGAFDMGGNVREWNETLIDGLYRGESGGGFYFYSPDAGYLISSYQNCHFPDYEFFTVGFRVASFPEPAIIQVSVDVKPGSCPNPLRVNFRGNGVLPVAILGSDDFDVLDIDITTITLEGVSPIRSSFEDVSTPFYGEECECSTEGPDGFDDLVLKFDRADILEALEDTHGDLADLPNRAELTLTLTAMLIGEEVELEGTDCLRILNRGAIKRKK